VEPALEALVMPDAERVADRVDSALRLADAARVAVVVRTELPREAERETEPDLVSALLRPATLRRVVEPFRMEKSRWPSCAVLEGSQ